MYICAVMLVISDTNVMLTSLFGLFAVVGT